MLKGDFSEDGKYWKSEEGVKYEVIDSLALMRNVKNGEYTDVIDMPKVYIKGKLIFIKTQFNKEICFEGTIFSEEVCFHSSKFMGNLILKNTHFLKGVNFAGSSFSKSVIFHNAIFYEPTLDLNNDFIQRMEISKNKEYIIFADFSLTYFYDNAIFTNIESYVDISFCSAIFAKHTSFSYSKFHSNAIFMQSRFEYVADFTGVFFFKDTYFTKTHFDYKVDFLECQFFGSTISFTQCSISNLSFLNNSFISGNTKLNSIFRNVELDFSMVIFQGYSLFHKCIFPSGTKFIMLTLFDALYFQDCDISMITFLFTDLSNVRFSNLHWPNQAVQKKLFIKRYVLQDERTAKEDKDWEELQRLYCQIRHYYENIKDFSKSEHFYYSEMEAKRKRETLSTRIFMWFYKHFLGYSLSIFRPVLTLLALIFILFPLIYAATGLESDKLIFSLSGDRFSWDLLEYSLKVSVFRKVDKFVGVPVLTTFVNTVQFILTVLLTGFTAFAVRKRFKR